jgi:hypothetical protein
VDEHPRDDGITNSGARQVCPIPRGLQVRHKVWVSFRVAAALCFSAIVLLGATFSCDQLSPILLCIIGAIPLMALILAYHILRYGIMQVHMRLEGDRLILGTGWFERDFACSEIELIEAYPVGRSKHGTLKPHIRIKGVTSISCCVYFPTAASHWIALLRDRCLNAIYVDEEGREYLPEQATQPKAVLVGLMRRRQRQTTLWGILTGAHLTCAWLVTVISKHMDGDTDKGWGLILLLLFGALSAPAAAYLTVKYMQDALQLRRTISKHFADGLRGDYMR